MYLIIGFTWLISSIHNIEFIKHTHWIVNVQAVSKVYTQLSKTYFPNVVSNSVFLVWPPDRSFSLNHDITIYSKSIIPLALFYGDAFKVIYKNQELETVFVQEDENLEVPNGKNIYDIRPQQN